MQRRTTRVVEGYDPSKPSNYLIYLDANNLYGWVMSLPLPKSGFKWKRVMPTEDQIMKMKENANKGWILEVDLDYQIQEGSKERFREQLLQTD